MKGRGVLTGRNWEVLCDMLMRSGLNKGKGIGGLDSC